MDVTSRFAKSFGSNMTSGTNNFQNSVTGMFADGAGEKAVLFIYLEDLSDPDSNEKDISTEVKQLNELSGKLLKGCKSKLGLKEIGNDIKSAFTGGTRNADKIGEVASEDANFIKFKVQYNPATIRLYSVNGKIQSRKVDEGIDNLKVYKFSGKSKLSFDLIFDNCDNMNAFGLNDVVNTNITGIVNKGINAIKQGKGDYSVRKKMDAIMSLLSSAATQQVIFFWAKMCFRGTITDVSNKFTMFNPQGNPIRGEMHLELTQDKKDERLDYDEQYWDQAFKKVFKEKNGKEGIADAANDTKGIGNMLANNNIINLSL